MMNPNKGIASKTVQSNDCKFCVLTSVVVLVAGDEDLFCFYCLEMMMMLLIG